MGFIQLVFLAFQVGFYVHPSSCVFITDQEISKSMHANVGDLNIGASIGLSWRPGLGVKCIKRNGSEQWLQAIVYAVKTANKMHILPYGLRLGFIIFDNCDEETIVLLQTVIFVPQICPMTTLTNTNRVIGVVGLESNSIAMAASDILGPARVPHISFYSSSESFKDKNRFPYFLSMVPLNSNQFEALAMFLKTNGWNYVSIVYTEDENGRSGVNQLFLQLVKNGGGCVVNDYGLEDRLNIKRVNEVVKQLVDGLKETKIVVLMLTNVETTRAILSGTKKLVPRGTFVWIGGVSLSLFGDEALTKELEGSFLVRYKKRKMTKFYEEFTRLTLADGNNYWFRTAFEEGWNCTATGRTPTCPMNKSIIDRYNQRPIQGLSSLIDSVMMLANATSRVLRRPSCKKKYLNSSFIEGCISGEEILKELYNTNQEGFSGHLELNKDGFILNSYLIHQVTEFGKETLIAEYNTKTKQYTNHEQPDWTFFHLEKNDTRPDAACRRSCDLQEVFVRMSKCCWTCKKCKPYERIVNTNCEACPPFTWPDLGSNLTICVSIAPVVMKYDDPINISVLAASMVGLLICLVVAALFVCHRKSPVIKASSRELSVIMLFAIAFGFFKTIVFRLTSPTEITCALDFLAFCISFNLIYGPLLLRTVRIYRIFMLPFSSHRKMKMSLISGHYQVGLTAALLTAQMFLCLMAILSYKKWSSQVQISNMNAVEVVCNVSNFGLFSFLLYNYLLIIVCTVLAFKTRNLPGDFNESLFISMCVSSNLILWVCFSVVYLSYSDQKIRTTFLTFVLLCNHTVAVVFLFLPKIYAVVSKSAIRGEQAKYLTKVRAGKVWTYKTKTRRKFPLAAAGSNIDGLAQRPNFSSTVSANKPTV